jgi:excinuclease ABC subunit C
VNRLDIKEKVKLLPEVPGVYLMMDSRNNIIYVGKSKNLKSRVGQYFRSSKNHVPKIVKMIQRIRDFEYIVTDTEFEALLLECRLIKELKPMYNSQMKNDLKYIYIRITTDEEFPRVLVSEEKKEDGSLYFGPYTSLSSIERAVEVIRENFQIRSCSGRNVPKNRAGCLSYQLGLCTAPCADTTAKSTYMNQVNGAILFLHGQDKDLLEKLKGKMEEASQRLDFNKAAKYRDDMFALNHVINKQKAMSFTKRVRNITALETVGNSHIKLFLIRDNKLLYSEKIEFNSMNMDSIRSNIKHSIMEHFDLSDNKEMKTFDKQDIDQAQIIFSYLKNRKNDCSYILIPNSWLKEGKGIRLNNGIDKLLSGFHLFVE